MNFPLSHISSLCKYTGISFTAGAVTHGFFSGERALWSAGFGIAVYLLGAVLEKLTHPNKNQSWFNLLAVGVMASVGIGLFTGGLLHFADSPRRSAWVVPLGFVLSLLAMYWMEGRSKFSAKGLLVYGSAGLAIVIAASLFALSNLNAQVGDEHGHSQGHEEAGHGH